VSLPLPYFGADTAENTLHTAKKGILSPDPQLMKIETKVRIGPAEYTGLRGLPRPMVARFAEIIRKCVVLSLSRTRSALEQDTAAEATQTPQ
jgi:hypothetical protein